MTSYQSDWIFSIGIKFTTAVCLGMLAVGLFMGLEPITALYRSGLAFVVFLVLAWAAAMIWEVSPVEDDDEGEDDESTGETEESSKATTEKSSGGKRFENARPQIEIPAEELGTPSVPAME